MGNKWVEDFFVVQCGKYCGEMYAFVMKVIQTQSKNAVKNVFKLISEKI